ncbi:MAG: MBL fold metallo-hydrolase [Planctomycetota bacterium]|nr:MBL fold metallo-hydrolase [Planctomycetota bacterium]
MDRHTPGSELEDRLYFRQLLSGRDFAQEDPIAQQMVNFVYLIGDRQTKEAVIVDPAYAISEIVQLAQDDEMTITGALATHYHPDHIGGDMMGHNLQGVSELLGQVACKVHVQRPEVPWVKRVTGLSDSDLQVHDSGDELKVGEIPIQLIHTPGHTPGSQCFLVQNRLVAGDTLFLQGCGRTDLPGGDPRQLYLSLTQKLAKVPDDAVLFPGHLYDPRPQASMGETRQSNYVFKPSTEEEWLAMFGR